MKKSIKFNDLSREWLEIKKFSVKESTFAKYKNILTTHLDNLFESKNLEELNDNDYRHLFSKIFDEKSISISLKKSIYLVLKSILDLGEKKYGLEHVDLSYVKIKSEKNDVQVLTDEEKKILSNYCQENLNYGTLSIYLSMYTGMRIGEICGLNWSDIDLENRVIYVTKTTQRLPSENKSDTKTINKICTPKTKTSKREVVMTDFLVDYLLIYKNTLRPESDECFLITNSLKIPEVRNVQRNFRRICQKLDININFHILRHTFATNCVKYDIDIKTLSELLGHSNVSTTLNLYVHPSLEYKKQQINKIPK